MASNKKAIPYERRLIYNGNVYCPKNSFDRDSDNCTKCDDFYGGHGPGMPSGVLCTYPVSQKPECATRPVEVTQVEWDYVACEVCGVCARCDGGQECDTVTEHVEHVLSVLGLHRRK